MKSFQLNDQQHTTIIAALRFYQSKGQDQPTNRDGWIDDLATNGHTQPSLDDAGIDELVEHLHYGGSTDLDAFKSYFGVAAEDSARRMCGAPVDDAGTSLAAFKADFDAKLAAMSDNELIAAYAAMGRPVVVRRSALPNIDDIALPEGYGEEDGEEDEECSNCGDPLDDGEGYDGLCGNCADVAVAAMSRRGIKAQVSRRTRDEIAEILESYGIQCYDHEDKETLVEALTVNICDSTIPGSVVTD